MLWLRLLIKSLVLLKPAPGSEKSLGPKFQIDFNPETALFHTMRDVLPSTQRSTAMCRG